ncbi:MAG: gamma-glutamyl-gamma-aminobutyrate hydrolase family protein [Oscillospiraceae bacterium]|jgi:putative glutamine amidotransferase|nr:gamma-glutamyl-gamma-aminobutyrate hydrolase family protein [Oscillospiraceae bacterium]
MDKPLIGVTPLWDEKKKSIWMLPEYLDCVRAAGAVPFILPLTDGEEETRRLSSLCDGFLFTGGQDVSPALYGQEISEKCGEICKVRDKMEAFIFKKTLETDKPALGICRGIQLFNALLGGTLRQDITTDGVLHMKGKKGSVFHTVSVSEPLKTILGIARPKVISYHHQCVDRLAPSLRVAAESGDGVIEAAYMPDRRFVWGVQWHPELAVSSPETKKLFAAFVGACSKSAGNP